MKLVGSDKRPAGSAEEAAAYWAMRLDAANCTPADRAAFGGGQRIRRMPQRMRVHGGRWGWSISTLAAPN